MEVIPPLPLLTCRALGSCGKTRFRVLTGAMEDVRRGCVWVGVLTGAVEDVRRGCVWVGVLTGAMEDVRRGCVWVVLANLRLRPGLPAIKCFKAWLAHWFDARGVSLKFRYVWRRSGACIARPTREGYRVVSRPRRTQRGACLGVAKRNETSKTRHCQRGRAAWRAGELGVELRRSSVLVGLNRDKYGLTIGLADGMRAALALPRWPRRWPRHGAGARGGPTSPRIFPDGSRFGDAHPAGRTTPGSRRVLDNTHAAVTSSTAASAR